VAVEREAAARAAAKVVAERETEVQAAERAGEAGQEACLTWQEACLIWQEACLIWQEACLAKATEPMAVAAGSTEVAMALVTWGQVMAAKMEA
jgi:hypothetical protein